MAVLGPNESKVKYHVEFRLFQRVADGRVTVAADESRGSRLMQFCYFEMRCLQEQDLLVTCCSELGGDGRLV